MSDVLQYAVPTLLTIGTALMGVMARWLWNARKQIATKDDIIQHYEKVDAKVDRRHAETQADLREISGHLRTLNGQVAENTKRSVANEAVIRERGI